MRTYIIERDLPSVGAFAPAELAAAARASNDALARLAPRVQWQHSWVAGDKTFCVYLAEDEQVIREHAALSGFPATTITPITARIDPTWG